MPKNPEVTDWFKTSKNPKTDEMEAIRNIILNINRGITENIKWNAPNFMYNDENICTINPKAKTHVALNFHDGAAINDPLNLLEGEGKKVRVAKFKDFAEVKSKKRALEMIINNYIKTKVVHRY